MSPGWVCTFQSIGCVCGLHCFGRQSAGADISAPAEDLLNKNPSLVALGKKSRQEEAWSCQWAGKASKAGTPGRAGGAGGAGGAGSSAGRLCGKYGVCAASTVSAWPMQCARTPQEQPGATRDPPPGSPVQPLSSRMQPLGSRLQSLASPGQPRPAQAGP